MLKKLNPNTVMVAKAVAINIVLPVATVVVGQIIIKKLEKKAENN